MSGVLKKIKTEPNDSAYYKSVKIKKEPTDWSQCKTVKIKTEPSVRIKTETSVKIKTEPSVKIKTEPSVKIKKEPKVEKPSVSESVATATTRIPAAKRSTTTRKYTTKRKYKTRRKRTTKLGKKRKPRRKKRRTTKKSRPTSRSFPPSADARTRITSKLGIGPPPKSPYGLPTIKNNQNEALSTSDLRAAAGISRLSLFGTELDTYDPPVSVEERSAETTDQSATNVDSSVRTPTNRKRVVSPVKKEQSVPSHKKAVTNSSVDLLGEIMQSQVKLHTSSRDITITRDGSVLLKTDSLAKTSSITSNKVLKTVNTKPNVSKYSETVNIKKESDDSKHCKSVTIKKELLIYDLSDRNSVEPIKVKKEANDDLLHSNTVKIKKEPKDSEKPSIRETGRTEAKRKLISNRKEQDDTIYFETVTIKAEKEYSTFHKKLKTETEIPVITLD